MTPLAAALLLLPALAGASVADLHVHVKMDAAIPGLFRGEPGDGPAGKGRFSNQVSLADLEKADVRLIAAAVYAPVVYSQLRGGYHAELLRQLAAVRDWAAKHPKVLIVSKPEDADTVLKSKDWRLGVILAAEGTHGVETPEKLDALWDAGLRLLTISHFVDSPWAGAAELRANGKTNPHGLTAAGRALVERALAKGLLLDLTHSSDETAKEVARLHPDLPLLFTHTGARELNPRERLISAELLAEVKRSKGMVGLTFGTIYVGTDLPSLLRHGEALAKGAGPDAVALGSDHNGMIVPAAGYVETVDALTKAGVHVDRSAEAFVALWRRVLRLGLSPMQPTSRAASGRAGSRSPGPARRRD